MSAFMSSTKERIDSSSGNSNEASSVKDWNEKCDMTRSCHGEFSRSSPWMEQNRRLLRNPFGQSNMFKNSTAVCFVCGNFAQEENMSKLYSRNSHSRVDASFFPFLEYHDPAPGADPMKDDWSVISCSVCSCLLSQQWKSFERSKMPINKRLYWLKRPSGCEIRQPVSQIELEEILNEHSKENLPERGGESNSDDNSVDSPTPPKRIRAASPKPKPSEEKQIEVQESTNSSDDKTQNSTLFVCYSCGKKDTMPCSIFPIHCKPSYEQMRAGVPYYPSVLQEKGASNAAVLYGSITFLCMGCLPKYKIEWHFMQKSFLEKDVTKMALPRIPLPELVSCYLCSSEVSTKFNDCIVYTHTESGKENSCLKMLSNHKQPQGSASLSFGFTYVCGKCRLRLTSDDISDRDSPIVDHERSQK